MESEANMMRSVAIVFLGWVFLAKAVWAQNAIEVFWVQIEAKPNFEEALESIEIYQQDLPDLNGFTMGSGWFGIALGPYTRDDAELVLQSFRAAGRIPRDSYIALGAAYQTQYWPEGTDLLGRGTLTALPSTTEDTPTAVAELPQATDVAAEPDPENRAAARRSENQLTASEKRDLQAALKWAGFYDAAIDGAFGRGTRNAMSIWQSANGFEPTGILTTRQRAVLMKRYNAPIEGLDLKQVSDEAAGIEIKLPTGIVAFDRYDPPFAHYTPKDGQSARVLLISQKGNRATLSSLYEVMQTLAVVPLEGPRNLTRNGFTLLGRNKDIVSETRATLKNGEIKGYTLIWPARDEERRARVIAEMEASFVSLPGVLDPTLGSGAPQRVDLIAGLELRKPILSRSGFFVNSSGAVVTTAGAVENCARITLDSDYEAELARLDAERGLAILRPTNTLAPPEIAQFSAAPPRIQSEVAVSGYSFEGQLTAPSVTFGYLSDVKGLSGEGELNRLALDALPGDEGGPVMDDKGHVMGMLLPRPTGSRQLPNDVRFALTSEFIANALSQAGLKAVKATDGDGLDPVDISTRGTDMTVLVSCWQ